jgi:4-hydroxythreonine-4-phosphate dehydrogenase
MWRQRATLNLPVFFGIGPHTSLAGVPIEIITTPDAATTVFQRALPVMDVPLGADLVAGRPAQNTARAAWDALKIAAGLALAGKVDGVVTAPINKENMYSINFPFPGQTEFFAAACTSTDYAMMLSGPELRTVPLTIHIPIGNVAASISTDAIVRTAHVILKSLRRDFGIAAPRLAICGLNPHAGENGAIGDEELNIIIPAIAQLQAQGEIILGPLPADTAFAPHIRSRFDAALCMYHDQALIPVKTLDFDRTVNITIGLPIIRTSPDHGTGFDIAGKGLARADSMIAALLTAQIMARNRRDVR